MDIITDDSELSASFLTTAPIEIKLLDTALDAGTIEGYGATFNGGDYGGDTIVPGAFAESIQQHQGAGSAPALLWSHNMGRPIGKITGIGENTRGLLVRGKLNLETADGQRAHAHMKAGDVTGLSIGYHVPPGGQKRGPNGTRVLSKVHLHEVSAVAVPMDHGARVTSVKSLVLSSRGDLEELLREGGLPRAAARKVAAVGWPALSGQEPDETPDPIMVELLKRMDARTAELKGLNK